MIINAFLLLQCLHELTSNLCYTYAAHLVSSLFIYSTQSLLYKVIKISTNTSRNRMHLTNRINVTDLPEILYVHLFVKLKDRSSSEAVGSLV